MPALPCRCPCWPLPIPLPPPRAITHPLRRAQGLEGALVELAAVVLLPALKHTPAHSGFAVKGGGVATGEGVSWCEGVGRRSNTKHNVLVHNSCRGLHTQSPLPCFQRGPPAASPLAAPHCKLSGRCTVDMQYQGLPHKPLAHPYSLVVLVVADEAVARLVGVGEARVVGCGHHLRHQQARLGALGVTQQGEQAGRRGGCNGFVVCMSSAGEGAGNMPCRGTEQHLLLVCAG